MPWVRVDQTAYRNHVQPGSGGRLPDGMVYADGRVTFNRPDGSNVNSGYAIGLVGRSPNPQAPTIIRIVVEEYESKGGLVGEDYIAAEFLGYKPEGYRVIAYNKSPPASESSSSGVFASNDPVSQFTPDTIEFPKNSIAVYRQAFVVNGGDISGDVRFVHRIEVWISDDSGAQQPPAGQPSTAPVQTAGQVGRKARVALSGRRDNASIVIDPDATYGATLGSNLFWPDGTLVKPEDLAPPATGTENPDFVYWRTLTEVPPNVQQVAALSMAGFVRRGGDGSWAAAAITNPDLASANTSGLAEGSNLYFTAERAQDAVGAAIAAGTGDGVTLTYDDAGNKIDATNTDKGSVAVASLLAEADPFPQYTTEAEASAAAVAVLAAHLADPQPHPNATFDGGNF